MAALGAVALLLSACSADPVQPRPDEPGGNHSGTGSPSPTITGTWQNVVVIQVPGDLQTWTTTWRFDADGACLQTNVTESLAEGFPRTTERSCTYAISGTRITVSYDTGGDLTFDFDLTGPASDVLVLNGFEYQRIG